MTCLGRAEQPHQERPAVCQPLYLAWGDSPRSLTLSVLSEASRWFGVVWTVGRVSLDWQGE